MYTMHTTCLTGDDDCKGIKVELMRQGGKLPEWLITRERERESDLPEVDVPCSQGW